MLLEATRSVRRELTRLSEAHKALACIGRTHGQHAIPITMGFKFANYLYEFSVAERYLERVEVRREGGGARGEEGVARDATTQQQQKAQQHSNSNSKQQRTRPRCHSNRLSSRSLHPY